MNFQLGLEPVLIGFEATLEKKDLICRDGSHEDAESGVDGADTEVIIHLTSVDPQVLTMNTENQSLKLYYTKVLIFRGTAPI